MFRAAMRVRYVLGATFAVALAGFAVFATAVFRAPTQRQATADAVVVLTGGELRLREGLKLFAAGAGRRLLITGVNRITTRDDLRRLSGVQPILFECCVDVGYLALDTAGNASETHAWLKTWGFQRLLVVTSNYHMPRALIELARELPNVKLLPHSVTPRHYEANEIWRHPSAIKRIVMEYLKMFPATARLIIARLSPPRDDTPLFPVLQREVNSRPRQLSGL